MEKNSTHTSWIYHYISDTLKYCAQFCIYDCWTVWRSACRIEQTDWSKRFKQTCSSVPVKVGISILYWKFWCYSLWIFIFSIPLIILLIGIGLFIFLILRKSVHKLQQQRSILNLHINIEQSEENNSRPEPVLPKYNNTATNPEIVTFQSLCIFVFFGLTLVFPAIYLFFFTDGFQEFKEFHYHIIDQLPPFVYCIVLFFGLYCRNRELRNFVSEMYGDLNIL